MPGITAHMVVKNEDRFVGYAIRSVLPYVDTFLITDTGSTDHTIKLISSIKSPKIIFDSIPCLTRADITRVRCEHIRKTKTDWIWLVDGDEIYPYKLCEEICTVIQQNKYFGIVVKRYDVLGDVFHCQAESVGSYSLYGKTGHFSTRVISRKKITGLNFTGDYPLEDYHDNKGVRIKNYPSNQFYFTKLKYWHVGYLTRSSAGSSLFRTLNRHKYKIETGYPINTSLPEIFYQRFQQFDLVSPLKPRSVWYKIAAHLITPIKKLKRMVKRAS